MSRDYDIYEVFDEGASLLSRNHSRDVAIVTANILASDGHLYGATRYEVRNAHTNETVYKVNCNEQNA